MDAVLRELHAQRAEALFLEVDETNAGAIALYRRLGFREVGKRPRYYQVGRRRAGPARLSCAAIFVSQAVLRARAAAATETIRADDREDPGCSRLVVIIVHSALVLAPVQYLT